MNKYVVLTILFTLLCFTNLTAQNVAVEKSKNVVVIKGESFYLHTVKAHQTLYSIGKAYNIDTEVIRKLNGKKDNSISTGDVLKIPYVKAGEVMRLNLQNNNNSRGNNVVEDVEPQEKDLQYRVQQGETLYSISRKFGVKVRVLKEINAISDASNILKIGTLLTIPIKGHTIQQNVEEVHEKKADDTKNDVVQNEIKEDNDNSFGIHWRKHGDIVKIAILLPFCVNEARGSDIIPSKNQQFMHFYEGFLIALDSLKSLGANIELYPFDTQRSPSVSASLASKVKDIDPDLIFGPVYHNECVAFLNAFGKSNVPVIYPLSTKNDNLVSYQNFIQINASDRTSAKAIKQWLLSQNSGTNIVHIKPSSTENSLQKTISEELAGVERLKHVTWSGQITTESLKHILSKDSENILVIPATTEGEIGKILPNIVLLSETYPITVVGLPEWQSFTSIDYENFYKLNVKLFANSYVDGTSTQAESFAVNFRNRYKTEPINIAYKAFDMGLYFIKTYISSQGDFYKALKKNSNSDFSAFLFDTMMNEKCLENKGFRVINYSSEYKLEVD